MPVQSMEPARHLPEAAGRIQQHRLRRHKAFSRLQLPAEIKGIQPDGQPRDIELIHLCEGRETAAVYETQRVDLPMGLIRPRRHEREKRIFLRAARPAPRLHNLTAMSERTALDLTLARPGARQPEQLIALQAADIDAGAERPLQRHGTEAPVREPHAAHDGIAVSEHGIAQHDLEPRHRIAQRDLQRLGRRLVRIDRRQSRQLLLLRHDIIAHIPQISDARAILLCHPHGRLPHIRIAMGRIFLRQCIEREPAVRRGIGRIRCERPVHHRHCRRPVPVLQPRAPVQMTQPAARHDVHDIARMRRPDMEQMGLTIKCNHKM